MNHATFPFRCNLYTTFIDSFIPSEKDVMAKNKENMILFMGHQLIVVASIYFVYSPIAANDAKFNTAIKSKPVYWFTISVLAGLDVRLCWCSMVHCDENDDRRILFLHNLNVCYWHRNDVSIIIISSSHTQESRSDFAIFFILKIVSQCRCCAFERLLEQEAK